MKYNNLNIFLLITTLFIITGCQEKFNGKSEKDFKLSKEKIEKDLNAEEKIKLEKALRVIAMNAMSLKWDKSVKYKGKSFNDIALELIDGLTYSSTTDLAEDFLQESNKEKMDKLSIEIKELEVKKQKIEAIEKQLELFKVTSLELNEIDWFSSNVPQLNIEYKYIGKTDLKGRYEIAYEVEDIKSKKAISIQSIANTDDDNILKSGESVYLNVILSQAQENNPNVWKNLNYPIKNVMLSNYGLKLKIYLISMYQGDTKVIRPETSVKELEAEIKKLDLEYKERSDFKGTLDELELTDK